MNNGTERIYVLYTPENQLATTTAPVSRKPESILGPSLANLDRIPDFKTVCRTCATVTEFVIPIFEGEGLQNNLADKIMKHLPIKVLESDELPRVVCYQCASTLLACHELVQCSAQADAALKARLAQLNPTAANVQSHLAAKQIVSKSAQLFYENVNNVLTEYLKSINMDGEISDYICQQCPQHAALPDVASLADHIRREHLLTERNSLQQFIQDNVAFEETLNLENSDRDSESESDAGETKQTLPNFFCPFCNSIFSSTTRLICHLNTHIEVCMDNGVTCCDTLYVNKKSFVDHLQEEHVRISGEITNMCKSCGYQADDADHLQAHVAENHDAGGQRKERKEASATNQKYIPAVCPECNKTFANKYNMFVHMKSHSGAKSSFCCDECGRAYSSRGNLRQHARAAHAGALPHACARCGEHFPSRRARDLHLRLHTGDRPFRCSHCGKAFRAKNSLDRHLDMHLDVRKYACDVCPKRFRKKTHLNYHLSTHRQKT